MTQKRNPPAAKDDPLPGFPGYRTRGGRTGYDPIDSRTEAAHTTGALVRRLLTGQLIVHSPITLFLLGAVGLLLVAPLIFAVSETLSGSGFSGNAWIFFAVTGLVGLVMLANFVKNLPLPKK